MRSFTLLELLVAVCVLLMLVGIFAGSFSLYSSISRDTALQNELINIRRAIEYFRFLTGRYPADLLELTKYKLTAGEYKGIITSNNFLGHARIDNKGFLLDPYSNRYGYDPETGVVWPNTKGRQGW